MRLNIRAISWFVAFIVSGAMWVGLFAVFAPAAQSTWRDKPPSRFQRDAVAAVRFTTEQEIQARCPLTGGQFAVGCTAGGVVYVPNPCRWGDPFATLTCHELGHVNGWTAAHER